MEKEFIEVPVEIVEAIIKYCEDKQVYDKLTYYKDFYYKLKKLVCRDVFLSVLNLLVKMFHAFIYFGRR